MSMVTYKCKCGGDVIYNVWPTDSQTHTHVLKCAGKAFVQGCGREVRAPTYTQAEKQWKTGDKRKKDFPRKD